MQTEIDGVILSRRGGRLRCLGGGSFGVVLHATAVADQAPAAFKLVCCRNDQEVLTAKHEKILEELPAHPHVVRLLSFCEHLAGSAAFSQTGELMGEIQTLCRDLNAKGQPFPQKMLRPVVGDKFCTLAFELAGDQDLFSWYEFYADAGDTPPDDKLRMVARQMAGALAHLHENGIVHHDFKSENVTVTITSAGVVTKLIDFGLARRASGGHPGSVGSVAGAAPEMWTSDDYRGPPADVWSYGGAARHRRQAPHSPPA